jgi:hypothetical protein
MMEKRNDMVVAEKVNNKIILCEIQKQEQSKLDKYSPIYRSLAGVLTP